MGFAFSGDAFGCCIRCESLFCEGMWLMAGRSSAPRQAGKPADDKSTGGPSNDSDKDYPQIPKEHPGLTGGPPTEPVPHAGQRLPEDLLKERERTLVSPLPGEENDGGESILSSRPREEGGERPPKPK
jgi:hypothetical protein